MKSFCYCLLFCFIPLLFSCSARRIEKEMTGSENPQITSGRIVFKYNCQKCHPNGEAGVGPSINNINLPGFLLRKRVRSRAFLLYTGKMPAFKKDVISSKELDDLVVYLKDLHTKSKQ